MTRTRRQVTLIVALSLPAPVVVAAQATPSSPVQAASGLTLVGLDGRSRAVSTTDLAHLARHDTTVSGHDGSGRYCGVALTDLLALVNAPLADSLRGRSLATYVLVEAADGYRVVLSIAELDSQFTDRVVILADRKDGRALPAAEGPYRLIVPGEKRPARWARQVVRISLKRATYACSRSGRANRHVAVYGYVANPKG